MPHSCGENKAHWVPLNTPKPISAVAEKVVGTEGMALEREFLIANIHENHRTMAQVQYWLSQYKLIARKAINLIKSKEGATEVSKVEAVLSDTKETLEMASKLSSIKMGSYLAPDEVPGFPYGMVTGFMPGQVWNPLESEDDRLKLIKDAGMLVDFKNMVASISLPDGTALTATWTPRLAYENEEVLTEATAIVGLAARAAKFVALAEKAPQ
jgi:hypothetical protein